jgi:hypothetical protein
MDQRPSQNQWTVLVDDLELAQTPDVTVHVAAWRWQSHHLNADTDLGAFITIPR